MRNQNYSRWHSPAEEIVKDNVSTKEISPIDVAMSKLIKMRDVKILLKASPPTIRKYAKLGYYKEYRFGQKLVFYDKEEILNFILSRSQTAAEEEEF